MTSYQIFRAENLPSIDPSKGIIIDVRTQMEHGEKRLTCAHAHVPLDELNPTDFMMRRGLDKESGVYIVCRSGKRAAQAAEKFIAEGYSQVYVVEGGLVACEACGHDLEGHATTANTGSQKTKAPISLERQVRIVAGGIAALGALLALAIHPVFAVIPLFVGGGLVFAGATDRCGMALCLTKAPWNKTGENTSCGTTPCSAPPPTGSTAGAKTGQSCQ